MGLTREIGRFVVGMSGEGLPEAARPVIRTGFTDLLGVMLAGWDEPACRVVRRAVTGDAGHGWTGLLRGTVPAPEAGLLLGTAAHVLDFDDTGLSGHPSAVLVPAVLAEAAATGADGAAMAAAYAAGYETWAELIGRESDPHHEKGWHPSAVFGTLAAAAAAAVLRRLDEDAATHAIGIAASLAGGVVSNFGSMTKSFQLGHAVRSGLEAVRMAEAGLTASPDALEHGLGLLRALSPRGRVDTASPAAFGARWHLLERGLNVKLYPVCYAAHRVLDAVGGLCRTHDVDPAAIEAVELEIGVGQARMLRQHAPRTVLEAKFSAEFAAASMAVARRCGPAELSEAFLARPELRALFPRVSVRTVEGSNPDEPSLAPSDRARIVMADGRVLDSGPVAFPRGHFCAPAGPEELREKFMGCAGPVLGEAEAAQLFERAQGIDSLPGVAALFPADAPALRGAA
ncbi:MmgE/PrpD family protein [Pararoseomonas sp. SCSIO 73927]|uniref:MmgE/PrpD family protein n=1 Tax=Pararoseomonas sp. SCSIO 73927 TaxID=3114537 RepID=UPI0030CA9278